MVLEALHVASLYLNPKKCQFYQTELGFLGHHISARGIEVNNLKANKILNWPVPKSTTDVHSFLRLVHYISMYLPKLAELTCILTPLTTKVVMYLGCDKDQWRWRSKCISYVVLRVQFESSKMVS